MRPEITELELLLDKINLLFSNMKTDGQIDKIEAELFLKYIHQLQAKVEQIRSSSILQGEIVTPQTELPLRNESLPEKTIISKNEIPEIQEQVIAPQIEKREELNTVNNEVNIKAFEESKMKEVPVSQKPEVQKDKKSLNKKPPLHGDEEDETVNFGLHNKLTKDKKTLADKIVTSKSPDLRSRIDLNERIFFIRHLFNGDGSAYEKVIKHLNTLSTASEVDAYIEQDLIAHLGWNDHEAISRFKEVADRKFKA